MDDSPPAAHARKQPRRVGHYEIEAPLGRGGMGVVFRARDLVLRRRAALKRPADEYLDDPEHLARFRNEARAAARLSHPNIVPIFEVFDHDGIPWLAMEYEEGSNLRDYMEEYGPLSLDTILQFGIELASALDAAHRSRILHRDVNPRNILVNSDGRALLTDFGLARFFLAPGEESSASTMSTQVTEDGRVLGTPGYMSPEQALGRPLDGRSDIFSLGAVLYEMCTGTQAFAANGDRGQILDALLHREPAAIGRLNYEVPERLEQFIRKAMAKQVDERYQHADELAVDLRTLQRTSLSQPTTGPDAPTPARRRLARWSSLVLAIAVTAVIAGLLMWPDGEPGPGGGFPPSIPYTESAAFQALLPEGPARGFLQRGLHYHQIEDETRRSLDDSIRMFHRATEIASDCALGWALLGEAYWRRYEIWGREDAFRVEAIRAVERAVTLDPDLPEVLHARAYGSLVEGEYAAAKQGFLRTVEARPGFDRAWAYLAEAHQYLEEYAEGLEALERALAINPEDSRHHVRKGLFHYHFSEFEAAVQSYEKALELNPDSTKALNNLAITYLQMSRFEEGKQALLRSIEIRDNATARGNLGTAYYYLGQYEEAAESYLAAARMEPSKAVHWANLGDALRALGRTEGSSETYQAAIDLAEERVQANPMDPYARMDLGLYCARARQRDCALREGAMAAGMQPNDAEILFRFSIVLCVLGDREDALDWLERAVRMGLTRAQIENDPDLPVLKEHPRYGQIVELAG